MGNSASTNGSPAKQKRGSKLFNRKKRRHSEHPNDSANSGKTERNYDWVLDCVVEYIQSGECSVYVDGFIDEHCLVFDANHNPLSPTKPNRDDDQEAKEFEYRQIHAQYKDMIESLLVLHLTKLGLTAKQFTDACQCASAQKDSLNSSILRYIHAINDFELFKRIMCERNMELEREAMKYLSQPAPPAQLQLQSQAEIPQNMTEEQQLKWALSESMAMHQPQRPKQPEQPQQVKQPEPEQKTQVADEDPFDIMSSIAPSAPMESPPTSEKVIADPMEMLMNMDLAQPKKANLQPLKLRKEGDTALEHGKNDEEELPMLTAASIQNIKQKQNMNDVLFKQKQMILNMRKERRKQNRSGEELEPGSSDWAAMMKSTKTMDQNASALPALHKSLFARMTDKEGPENGGGR